MNLNLPKRILPEEIPEIESKQCQNGLNIKLRKCREQILMKFGLWQKHEKPLS